MVKIIKKAVFNKNVTTLLHVFIGQMYDKVLNYLFFFVR